MKVLKVLSFAQKELNYKMKYITDKAAVIFILNIAVISSAWCDAVLVREGHKHYESVIRIVVLYDNHLIAMDAL